MNGTRWGLRYGLAYEGISLGFDTTNDEHMLQLGVTFRNMSSNPILYTVKRFDVVIENRTIAKPIFTTFGGTISRAMARTYRYPAFAKKDISEFIGRHVKGSIKVEVEYGHPESQPVRRFWLLLDIDLRLDDKPGSADIIAEETNSRI